MLEIVFNFFDSSLIHFGVEFVRVFWSLILFFFLFLFWILWWRKMFVFYEDEILSYRDLRPKFFKIWIFCYRLIFRKKHLGFLLYYREV